MIGNRKIIIATTASNAIMTGYYPTCYAAIKSWASVDFIDEVIVAEGLSEDNTIQKLSSLSQKVKFISKHKWPVDNWNWQNLYDQYDTIYNYCLELEEDVIMIYLSSDQVFTDNFKEELRIALKLLEENNKLDFFLIPFAKTINYEFVTERYGYSPHFHLHSALKFDKQRKWLKVRGSNTKLKKPAGEDVLVTIEKPNEINPSNGNRMFYDFKSFPICYDMFMFTVKNLQHKIERYGRSFDGPAVIYGEGDPWPKNYQEYLSNIWLRKTLNLRPSKIPFSFHPIEMRHVMSEYLDETRFGYNCFDMLIQQVNIGIRRV